MIKLNGYIMTGMLQIQTKSAHEEADLNLSCYRPIVAFIHIPDAGTNRPPPGGYSLVGGIQPGFSRVRGIAT